MICIAVIRSRENGECERGVALRNLIFVSFLCDLMPSNDETQLIIPKKRLTLNRTIEIATISEFIVHEIISPSITRIAPQHITHRLILTDLLKAINPLDLI